MAPNNPDIRRRFFFQAIQICILTFALFVSPAPVRALSSTAMRAVSRTGNAPSQPQNIFPEGGISETALPDYKSFFESVQNGEKGILRGVYVPGVLALPIVQQPVGNPGFVSQNNDEITQFSMAAEVGNVGLLAHNYLSGTVFFNISVGQEVRLIYGDGAVEYYIVDQIFQYQALQPYSPNSNFRDLETNLTITAEELFRLVYRGERHVTFQTCIEANGIGSWGRIFIIAHPKLFPYVEQQYILDNLLPFVY